MAKPIIVSLVSVSIGIFVAGQTPGIFSNPNILEGYQSGVQNFNAAVGKLISYTSDTNLGLFIKDLFHSVEESHSGFDKSSAAALEKHNELNTRQAKLQNDIDHQRASLQEKGKQKEVKNQELAAKQQVLAQNEQHLRNTQNELAELSRAVEKAEKKYKKCKKNIFCRTLGKLTGHRKKYKKRRDKARRLRDNYAGTVNNARQAVTNTQNEITALNQVIQSLQTTIASLNDQIAQLNKQQTAVIALKDKINPVNAHLSKLVSHMGTSLDAIQTSQAALVIKEMEVLVDFDSFVNPILEAGQVLSANSAGSVPKLSLLTVEDKQALAGKLAAIKGKIEDLRTKYGDDTSVIDAWNRDAVATTTTLPTTTTTITSVTTATVAKAVPISSTLPSIDSQTTSPGTSSAAITSSSTQKSIDGPVTTVIPSTEKYETDEFDFSADEFDFIADDDAVCKLCKTDRCRKLFCTDLIGSSGSENESSSTD